jgi:hypothetical protein
MANWKRAERCPRVNRRHWYARIETSWHTAESSPSTAHPQPPTREKTNCCHFAAPFQSGGASSGHIVWRRGELLVEVLRDNSRRFEMNPLLMVYFSVGASFAGVALLKLQARLERWAYQRHAED